MGDKSAIEWTDHTFNPWWGCWRVSPGCDHCYAAAFAKRYGHDGLWDTGKYREFGEAHWVEPYRWNDRAKKLGVRHRVFCGSMCDWADNKADPELRDMLWDTIRKCDALDWLMLTKRIGNVPKMLPDNWGDGWPHVLMGISVVNQDEADRDIPKLLALPAAVKFLSCEPLLGPIDFRRVPGFNRVNMNLRNWWVIVGGESGPGARPMHPDWARSIRDQCQVAGVAFFFKQWGEWAPGECCPQQTRTARGAHWWGNSWTFVNVTRRQGEELHRDDEPDVWHVGKKRAGRLLDGREWSEFPHA